jgi:hypothetical protein
MLMLAGSPVRSLTKHRQPGLSLSHLSRLMQHEHPHVPGLRFCTSIYFLTGSCTHSLTPLGAGERRHPFKQLPP